MPLKHYRYTGRGAVEYPGIQANRTDALYLARIRRPDGSEAIWGAESAEAIDTLLEYYVDAYGTEPEELYVYRRVAILPSRTPKDLSGAGTPVKEALYPSGGTPQSGVDI